MFKILMLTLGAAVVAGWLARGRLRNLAGLHFRGVPIILGSLLVALLPLLITVSDGTARVLSAIANVVVLAFLVVNARAQSGGVRAGIAVMIAGWALNALVITANAGMPLSTWAYAQSGQTDPITAGEDGFYKIVIADDGTILKPLGDVIPIRAIAQVVSIGDILLVAGIDIAVVVAMRRRQEAKPNDSG